MKHYHSLATVIKIFYIALLLTIGQSLSAQVKTFFRGATIVSDKNVTINLYSMDLFEDCTHITYEVIFKRNLKNFDIRRFPFEAGGLGFDVAGVVGENGTITPNSIYLKWGWKNVKEGHRYYYTLYYKKRIPSGISYINIALSESKVGPFSINNSKGKTMWDKVSIKSNIDTHNDGICGLYKRIGGNEEYACVFAEGRYEIIYLNGNKQPYWQSGDRKAILKKTTNQGLFGVYLFYEENMTIRNDVYYAFDGGGMTFIHEEQNASTNWYKETLKDNYLKTYPTSSPNRNSQPSTNNPVSQWTGTGFALLDGCIATNYHVVENAKSIRVQGIGGSFNIHYNAEVIATDKHNDIAIIKISDNRFNGFGAIPYSVKKSMSEVGEDVFVLGYPLTTTMGDEIKLTTGIISSRTGFQGDVSLYQISAPIQPGNSGGPLFDNNGNLIGIVNAKHKDAENVSYAIKVSYLNNLVESASSKLLLPSKNIVSGMTLSNKVKAIKNFVFLITCSNTFSEKSSNLGGMTPSVTIINNPTYKKSTSERAKIKRILLGRDYTAVEIVDNNKSEDGYYESCNIDRNTHLIVNGTQYVMTRADGIKIAPEETFFSYDGQSITFTLYFPPIPTTAKSMDLIESVDSEWNFWGINIR